METWTYVGAVVALAVAVAALFSTGRSGRERRIEARLAEVERKLDLIIGHLDIRVPEPAYLPDVLLKLQQGRFIHAIKAYREATGAGLAEAKAEVERIARERGLEIR